MKKNIVRYASEITLKGRVERKRLTDILVSDISNRSECLNIKLEITKKFNHIMILSDSKLDFLQDVSGISSVFKVLGECDEDLQHITDTAVNIFKDIVSDKSFMVKIKKSSSGCRYSSNELACEIGSKLLPFARKVDLTNPEVEVRTEYIDGIFHFGLGRVKGLGGMPQASQGRALVLYSGGFDSTVAAFLLMKRGIHCDFLFFNFGYEAYRFQVLQIIKKLTNRFQPNNPRFITIDFNPITSFLIKSIGPRYRQILLKRIMYKIADEIGNSLGIQVMATGESIGQVSSQTIESLRVIEEATSMMVFRPLVSMDKTDIINKSHELGVGKLCEKVSEHCNLVKGKVSSRPSLDIILKEEQNFDFNLVDECIKNKREDFLDSVNLASQDVYLDKLDNRFDIIDCQELSEFNKCHIKTAKHLKLDDIDITNFSIDKRYVLYCSEGFLSAMAVQVFRESGLEAYAFEGGLKRLKKLYPDMLSPSN